MDFDHLGSSATGCETLCHFAVRSFGVIVAALRIVMYTMNVSDECRFIASAVGGV